MSTLFAQILPIFTNQTERVATEALRHILQQSEAARNSLERMLVDAGVEAGSLATFTTEEPGDGGERVDLVCFDASGTKRVLIEAKFWAGLTDNQPNTYLASLPEDTHSALLFVAPAQRIETLWPELCRRAEEQHKLRDSSDTPTSSELRGVSIDDNGHKMMLTSWRAVLERMESQASIAGDSAVVRDIEQLVGLTERMDSDAFLPLHSDELGHEIPRRILGFNSLVDDATQRAVARGIADTPGRSAPRWHGYGRSLRLGGIEIWFGINLHHWAISAQTPLWIHSSKENLWYWIELPTGVEHSVVLESVVDQLASASEILAEEQSKSGQDLK